MQLYQSCLSSKYNSLILQEKFDKRFLRYSILTNKLNARVEALSCNQIYFKKVASSLKSCRINKCQ